jgi:hypothetical protein
MVISDKVLDSFISAMADSNSRVDNQGSFLGSVGAMDSPAVKMITHLCPDHSVRMHVAIPPFPNISCCGAY